MSCKTCPEIRYVPVDTPTRSILKIDGYTVQPLPHEPIKVMFPVLIAASMQGMHPIFADDLFVPSARWKKAKVLESDFVTSAWTNTSIENRKYVQRFNSKYINITKNRRFFFEMQHDENTHCCPHVVVIVPLTCNTPTMGAIESPSISISETKRHVIKDVEYGSIDNL